VILVLKYPFGALVFDLSTPHLSTSIVFVSAGSVSVLVVVLLVLEKCIISVRDCC